MVAFREFSDIDALFDQDKHFHIPELIEDERQSKSS
jgi:hypothetical protein